MNRYGIMNSFRLSPDEAWTTESEKVYAVFRLPPEGVEKLLYMRGHLMPMPRPIRPASVRYIEHDWVVWARESQVHAWLGSGSTIPSQYDGPSVLETQSSLEGLKTFRSALNGLWVDWTWVSMTSKGEISFSCEVLPSGETWHTISFDLDDTVRMLDGKE